MGTWSPAGVNVLSEEKKQQVLALGRLGWSLRRIQDATGVRRETASQYLKAAGVAVRAARERQPPKPASQASTDPGAAAKPASQTFTDPGAAAKPASQTSTDPGPAPTALERPGRSPTASACEPCRELIELALRQGRNAMAIWQDLVTDHGFAAGYASVKRYVVKLRGAQTPEERAVIETAPGEEAQVDYGDGPMVRHPETGKYRRTRLFVLTLGYSRKSIRLLVFRSSSRAWAELHETAFRRLGGTTRVVVLDNLKEGVLEPDIYDPTVNPLFRDVLAHYGVVALPCRVRDADRKGKVERGVGHAKNTPLKGLRFESLAEAQAYLDRWEERWADTRIHGTTKRQVAAMFAEEQPHLQPLPIEPFRYYQYGTRTVHLDGCVEVEAAYYHAPPGWIGRDVHVQWDGVWVRLLNPRTGELLREYLREERGRRRALPGDQPKHTHPRIAKLLGEAGFAGKNVGALCDAIWRRENEPGVRRVQGVMYLVKKYGAATVDDACGAVLELGIADYKVVRRYLERRPAAPLSLKQVDPLIRALTHYRDLINQKTEGDPP
jgi:transposase